MIALRASVEPALFPADALTDVVIRLVLTNEGDRDILVYPSAAKISDASSYAGAGISWLLRFLGPDGPVHQREVCAYRGPPGEPPSADAVRQRCEETLAPGASAETVLTACWIPNARLTPAHLDPAHIDPSGWLFRRISLEHASLFAYQTSVAEIEPLIAARPDFLAPRFSTVVAFFIDRGDHELDAGYGQHSWMGVGEKLAARAPAVRVTLA